MDRTKLVELLSELNSEQLTGRCVSDQQYEEKFTEICDLLKCNYGDICTALKSTTDFYFSEEISPEWKYISLNLYVLYLLNNELESKHDILSVQQSRTAKKCITNIIKTGIYSKLRPTLPFYESTRRPEPRDIFLKYNIMKCTTYGLYEFLNFPKLRLLILPEGLRGILVAAHQIAYCKLKFPQAGMEGKSTGMSDEMYARLVEEKRLFLQLLQHLRQRIHPGIYVKETMSIMHPDAPDWFKKSVATTLTYMVQNENGLEFVAMALIDGANNDTTETWKIFEVFSNIVGSCMRYLGCEEQICNQLIGMLDQVTDESLVYERMYAYCTKTIYQVKPLHAKEILLRRIMKQFLDFSSEHDFTKRKVLSPGVKQTARLLRSVFVFKSLEPPTLPNDLFTPIVQTTFKIYAAIKDSIVFKATTADLRSVLLSYLEHCPINLGKVFRSLLYDVKCGEILWFRSDAYFDLDQEGELRLYCKNDGMTFYKYSRMSRSLTILLENCPNLLVHLFGHVLDYLVDSYGAAAKYGEDPYMERHLCLIELLGTLTENEGIQYQITANPGVVIKYINNVFERTIAGSLHKSDDVDSPRYQSFYITLRILHCLMMNTTQIKPNKDVFKSLMRSLVAIRGQAANKEVRRLVDDILGIFSRGKVAMKQKEEDKSKSVLEKALEDVFDPLLPVRGHAIMALTQLVQKKDKDVLEKEQYILTVFQTNLVNTDSYIYLSAIAGLTAMADAFPDTVLNLLCDEYSHCSLKTLQTKSFMGEIRMKIGECLVRVTKLLGEMAVKYKPLLLNTFLSISKDDDHLLRASSLSNLGEICRVLGYKLGTMVTEVLVCTHAIITTDKAPEPRRAAVTVLRQLLAGLESEMIAFLKEDILPIYRTLKEVYNNDEDDVMKLQAQLALEELNENMKTFVFPKPELNMEKKIIVLK